MTTGAANMKSADLARWLERRGYAVARESGDHHVYTGPGGTVSVPRGGRWERCVPYVVIRNVRRVCGADPRERSA